jgi:hypothetical protein
MQPNVIPSMLNRRRERGSVSRAASGNRTPNSNAPTQITSQQRRITSASLPFIAGFVLHLALFATPLQPIKVVTDRPPREWAVEVAANEIVMLQHSDTYLRYRMHIVDQKGDQLRDVIESRDGTVARLIQRDGRSLTSDEDAAEQQRLQALLTSPEIYARHIRNDASGKKMAVDLIRQMPDAMIYTYVPGQPQRTQDKGSNEVVLDYSPNPKWSPQSTMAEGLTGLEGRLWIDPKSHEMVRMEGHIFKPVNVGWGMLAHVFPGGNLILEQTNAGGQRWIYTHFTQEVSIRALMVKTLKVNTQIDTSAYQVLPGALGYQDAIRQLLATPLPIH